MDCYNKVILWRAGGFFSSPNAGAAHSGDGFCGLGHTRYQQLKQVLQHRVDHALVPDVCMEKEDQDFTQLCCEGVG